MPESVVAVAVLAWKGPCRCHVNGELAEPIRATRGLPQGGSIAPPSMTLSLATWNAAISQTVSWWLYMDDRSTMAGDRSLPAASDRAHEHLLDGELSACQRKILMNQRRTVLAVYCCEHGCQHIHNQSRLCEVSNRAKLAGTVKTICDWSEACAKATKIMKLDLQTHKR